MTTATLIILLTTLVGLSVYIMIAQKQKNDRVEKFFLAGRNIGINLFEHTTWATSYGSQNGIWYAVWLGYSLGLAGIWLQSFWILGIIGYSALIPYIVKHSEKYTLHGFLGAYFGKTARLVASFVSLTGLFVCIGFEVYYLSDFFQQVSGLSKELIVPIIIGISIFFSVFCTIGGFSANAKTDKITNILATLSLCILLIVLLYYKYQHNIKIDAKDITIMPLAENPKSFYWGIVFFGLYQLVDMTNWQTVSANSLKDDKKSIKKMQKHIRKAAINIFIFPITIGTVIGFLIRSFTASITQDKIMGVMSTNYFPNADIISIFILAIITFSFVVASLSATDSWLLASSQTISWDIIDYKIFNKKNFSTEGLTEQEHSSILRKARLLLILIGVIVTLIIYWISLRWNQVFALQFVMFGAGLSMIPALVYGLIYCKSENVKKRMKLFSTMSIISGFLLAILTFLYSIYINDPNIVNHIPYVTLIVSTVTLFMGLLLTKKQPV